ncbi:MAG: phosphatidate cytidylyltransferase [Rubellimicrobium sp.]|nr:phosphatidate cytidylyltransferase [Rubellimicrobium sp.]
MSRPEAAGGTAPEGAAGNGNPVAGAPDPAPPDPGRWHDLSKRVASGAALVVVGGAALVAGGAWYAVLVTFTCAVIIWELARIVNPAATTEAALLAMLGAAAMTALPRVAAPDWEMLLLVLPALAGLFVLGRRGPLFAVFALGIAFAGWALLAFRADPVLGFGFVLWLLSVVVATDMAGYFAGRHFGGPRFWPAVSPKKTWSGTAAGWIAAAAVGLAFLWPLGIGFWIVPVSVLVSFASQMGDIVESALKRHFGVKDSSDLIPGHGGVWDRFDAVLGAAGFVMAVRLLTGWPG